MGDELVQELANLNIEQPQDKQSAWEAIYSYMYPHLKEEIWDSQRVVASMLTDRTANVLSANERWVHIDKAQNNIRRIIHVQHYLRRLAGRRHN